ncbi:hypothetical protein SERLA73DRAFT_161174 [Serpula lacrymans var. lacrymans S7.3]|uniref:Yeast cell wall synthesis Kre9/Knh1-like N-terminal domain-containing protein n=2 Tax=Serpula lacrymans var. lacrymans TaxID=341189 RepID=F8PZQ1_SERL3|nr:uncharacterized protein SERLADRAFT_416212 [Serpula lacrymans var. lacrymans S7.9]EGN98373.1 hypothetical protein SERLA73DRAFT_161174 [Serpula lacrymans var. lacrymans S7.3]EGO23927.1 hypothetical protein SERLADRAFT_416212 [Serpula lacrymans var. lacrymans S7.9]
MHTSTFCKKPILYSVLLLITSTDASIKPRDTRIVHNPSVINPNADTIWHAGSSVTITWDTSTVPLGNKSKGKVVLGYLEKGKSDEHLDIEHPLAENFYIEDGFVQITAPDVSPRNDYIVVLFGDSGNKSPAFTIT